MIQFRALGEVAAVVDGDRVALGGSRQRRLLAMLLIHRNGTVSTDRLADAVFAGEPTEAAATTMRSYIARIRRVIDGHDARVRVVTQAPGYRLDVPDELFDVALFEASIAEAERSLARGDAESARQAAVDAIGRWTGDPYPEFDDEMWVLPEAQRLHELRLVAADRRIEADLACGRAREAVPEIERLVREHPMREGFRAHLMTALYRSGRQADALRAYQAYRAELADELGLDPSPALSELEQRILAHDPSLAAPDTGRSLHGYRLGERLGSGDDGTLYAATLPGVGRDLVLRSFRAEVADRPGFVRSFESDAHRLASLRHPAVVAVHDYWRGPHEAYLATARLAGGTLADRLRSGPLPDRDLVELVERVGGALVDAADAGITHGRLSPTNVVFDDEGTPFVTDFALGADERPDPAADVAAFAALVERCTSSVPLREHLGRAANDPATTMADLVADVLRLLDAQASHRPNPYKGLEAFEEADAADFHGRDDLVAGILKRFHAAGVRSRLVLVVGGSGTGKSSVVRAGVLPHLRAGVVPGSGRWLITTCTPGANPFQRLADALTRVSVNHAVEAADLDRPGGIDACAALVAGDDEVLLLIDQLEELFTLAEPVVQRRFLDGLAGALTAAPSRLRVIATLRADFFDRPLGVASFGSLVNASTVTVPAMTPAELEAAIVEPARRADRSVEGPVVAELVAAVLDDAAALPALQFTLRELAERSNGSMTLAAYRELGGVAGAVAARADELYHAAPGPEQDVLRRLFERLVVVRDGEATRRRVRIADLTSEAAGPGVEAVIERWAAARLLTLDRDHRTRVPSVEVAHEALVREWPRLGRWIAEDRETIGTIARIGEAARAWVESGRDDGSLARGVALQAALDVADRRPLDLTPLELDFVTASRRASAAAQAEQAAQLARERRSNRRLRWQLTALASVLVLALIVGVVAVDQRRQADGARRSATARELAAAATANLDVDPERSVLLALEALDLARGSGPGTQAEAATALHDAVVRSRIVRRIDGLGGTVDWSPTGEYLVSEGPEDSGTIDLRDPETGASVRSWQGDPIDINDVAFSPDGSMLATTGDDGRLQVWDPDTGALVFEHRETGSVWGPGFSGDGRLIAASWIDEGVVRVFDTSDGGLVGEGDAERVFALSLSDDGTTMVLGAGEGTAYVVAVPSGQILSTLEAPGAGPMRIVRYSPDDRLIAASSGDGVVRVWDPATGERQFQMDSGTSALNALAWSADGRHVAAGAEDGTAHVWEVGEEEARRVATLTAQDTRNGVQGVAFSPDGTQLVTGDVGVASMIVWDLDPLAGREWAAVRVREYGPVAVTTEDHVVAVGEDGRLWSFSMEDGVGQPVADPPPDVQLRLAADPGGTVLATAAVEPGEPVQLWDAVTGAQLASFVPPDFDDFVTGLAWSPDGQHLAVAGGDGDSSSIVVVDRAGRTLARFREEPEVYLRESMFSPDGTVLAIPRRPLRQATPDQQGLWLWDWAAGEMIGRIDAQVLDVDWDPAGERLVTIAELESRVEIWDAATLAPISSFTGTSAFSDVRYSPDGSQVATSGTDGDVNLWDVDTGTPTRLRGHDAHVAGVAFSPDGRRLVSVDAAGVMRAWAIDVDDLVAIAQHRLTRGLSEVECRRFLHRDGC